MQSLSRSYTNAAGQVTHSDSYFDLSGLTYTTSTSSRHEQRNFYRTEYAYDSTGQLNKTTTPLGTISRTVHDGLGRAVSEWIGTDDTPTTGNWSPTNLTGTNIVKVREYEYDGGGVGDGNRDEGDRVSRRLGRGTRHADVVRLAQPRRGSQARRRGSESTSLNRPLVYSDLDNLGEVTKTRVYDADSVRRRRSPTTCRSR